MERRGLRVKSIDTCGSEHQGLEDVREGDDAPRVPVLVHQNQAMDLWVQSITGGQRAGNSTDEWKGCAPATHLLLGDAVNDVLHGFVGVAGEDALQAHSALPQRLPHADVQVVVGLLCCQVLGGMMMLRMCSHCYHGHANMLNTHNDIKPGVEPNHLTCKETEERVRRGWQEGMLRWA